MANTAGNVIYILGTGHSGSTLLERILATDETTVSVGGVRYLDRYFAGESGVETDDAGHRATESPLWRQLAARPERYLASVPAVHTLSAAEKVRLFLGRPLQTAPNFHYQALYDDVRQRAKELELRAISTVIDSSKTVRSLSEIMSSVSDAVYVIHLTRDVRGVANSNHRRGLALLTATRYWLTDLIYARLFLWWHVPKQQRLALRYEEFVKDPACWLKQINQVCGLSVDPEHFLQAVDRFPSYRFAGNQMRARAISTLTLDEAWRRELPLWYRWLAAPLRFLRP